MHHGPLDLTPAERAIFDSLIGPKTVAEIATSRSKGEKTLHNQIAAIDQKLGVESRSQLMALVLGDRDQIVEGLKRLLARALGEGKIEVVDVVKAPYNEEEPGRSWVLRAARGLRV